jgi:hypothetical protein
MPEQDPRTDKEPAEGSRETVDAALEEQEPDDDVQLDVPEPSGPRVGREGAGSPSSGR